MIINQHYCARNILFTYNHLLAYKIELGFFRRVSFISETKLVLDSNNVHLILCVCWSLAVLLNPNHLPKHTVFSLNLQCTCFAIWINVLDITLRIDLQANCLKRVKRESCFLLQCPIMCT